MTPSYCEKGPGSIPGTRMRSKTQSKYKLFLLLRWNPVQNRLFHRVWYAVTVAFSVEHGRSRENSTGYRSSPPDNKSGVVHGAPSRWIQDCPYGRETEPAATHTEREFVAGYPGSPPTIDRAWCTAHRLHQYGDGGRIYKRQNQDIPALISAWGDGYCIECELRMDTGTPAGTFGPTRTRTRKNRTRARVGSKTRTGYPRVLFAPAGAVKCRLLGNLSTFTSRAICIILDLNALALIWAACCYQAIYPKWRKEAADMRLWVKCSRWCPCEKSCLAATEVAFVCIN
ncbi:hypothetical protein DFH07DRAFT_785896 [Mycena maculata]|uniref:Uncharacterized protein n=1 Tax=Mycena maculata TaxID=230809 RepID=A0AAD7MEH7_9AGAR|nr:hypothetical protein DFH07DRAFT_785896 [Mycena maculata]